MRVFIALDLPENIRDYLFKLESELQTGVAKVRWVSKRNLHFTLKFIGEVKEEKVKEIIEKLKTIQFQKQKVQLTNIGFFPNSARVNVIWVGIAPEDPIIQIQQKVDEAFLSMFPQDQKFKSHLTIGRVVSIKKQKEYLQHLRSVNFKPLEFTLEKITLYKSDLKTSGPSYTALESIHGID